MLQLAIPAGGEAAPLLDQEEGGGGLPLPGALGGSRTASLTRFNQGEGGAGDPSLRKGPLGRLSARLAGSLHRHHSSSSDSSHSSRSSSDTESEGAQVEVPDLALPGEPIGIITIEDVIEELMGQEILDETDHFADNECTMEVNDEMRAQMARNLPDRIKHVLMAGLNAGGSGRGLIMRRLSHLSRHSRQSNPNSVALSRSSTPPPTATDMRLSGSQRTLAAMSAEEAGGKGQGLQ
ncbi:hypothetical protein QJQ45_030496 [Haematococcus lacustris]|nr:hypothetical protein QJQ45_030496 [Haematococcus lacustris]